MHYTECIYIPPKGNVDNKVEVKIVNNPKSDVFGGKDGNKNFTISLEEDIPLIGLIGGSRSGKTTCCIKHTIYRTCNAPFVAIDIKGDLCKGYETTGNPRKAVDLSFREEPGWTIDPLQDIMQANDKVPLIKELVNSLFPLPVNEREPYWIESQRSIVTAGMVYHINGGSDDFIAIMFAIASNPPGTLIQIIAESDDFQAKVLINNFIKETYNEETDTTVVTVNCDSKALICISQGITNRLNIFTNDLIIQRVLSKSDNQVKWNELDDYNVFISIPEDRLEQYSGVQNMLITGLIRVLERRHEMFSPEGKDQLRRLIVLDEFFSLGKNEILTSTVSRLGSKGVTFIIAVQSLAQIDLTYGEKMRRVLMDNMMYILIFRITDVISAKYFSELIGTGSVEKTSYTTSWGEGTCSFQNSYVDEPIIRPHEFRTQKDIVVITPDGIKRVKKVFYHENPSGL